MDNGTTARTFVIADIHGAYKALKQVFKLSGFNYEKDNLICLGDTADGYPDVRECNEIYQASGLFELLEGKRKVFGNGHHIRQQVAQFCEDLMKERWIEEKQKNGS